jgi:electron transport complex protein RnfA
MSDLLLAAIAAATVNNIVLERLLGLGPVLGPVPGPTPESRIAEALRTGLATTGALAVTTGLGHLLNEWLLVPMGLVYLRIIALVALSAVAVQAVTLLVARSGASRSSPAGEYAPRITMNCVVLGAALLTTGTATTVAGASATGAGAGLGFTAVVTLFASLQPRLELVHVPQPLRGPPVALITVGIMSLAFRGFSGLGS